VFKYAISGSPFSAFSTFLNEVEVPVGCTFVLWHTWTMAMLHTLLGPPLVSVLEPDWIIWNLSLWQDSRFSCVRTCCPSLPFALICKWFYSLSFRALPVHMHYLLDLPVPREDFLGVTLIETQEWGLW
jgi:hypothetical protein